MTNGFSRTGLLFVLRTMAILLLVLAVGSSAAVKKKRFDVNAVKDSANAIAVVAEEPKAESFSIQVVLVESQKVLREKVTAQITAMKSGDHNAIWFFLAICFIYGLIHALGPGHGKSVVVGFFLARRGGWRQGVALGAGITFTHTLSAVLLLFILYIIFKATVFSAFEVGRGGIENVSYCLVMLTGLLLTFLGVKDLLQELRNRKNGEGHANLPPAARWKDIIGVAAITGIVPCPAVALIVLFCLLNSMIGLALIGSLFICLGMTITNVSFGLAAVAFRKGIDKGSLKGRLPSKIYVATSILGGLVIFSAGLLLFTNQFAGRV